MNVINFINGLNKPKNYLLLGNVLLMLFLIILTNLKILPFENFGDFVFFAIIGLALALYRPGWAFLFFIGTIMLENISVAPQGFFIDIRPYQFFGAITILALIIRYFSKRLNFKLVKLRWFDYAMIVFGIAGLASAFFAEDKGFAFKQSIIILSYVFLYLLVRNYIQTLSDLKKVIPFFISSSIIVVLYGIWQNIAFVKGLNSFEVMPGRPNATFTEADWLGIFITLLIAVIYSIIYYFNKSNEIIEDTRIYNSPDYLTLPIGRQVSNQILNLNSSDTKYKILDTRYFLYVLLIPIYILLILTVSRSAWIGAGIVTIIFLKIILTDAKFNTKFWRWNDFLKQLGLIILAFITGLLIIYVFHLTNFQLANRAGSAGTGLQKITASCLITDCVSQELDCAYQKELKTGDTIKNIDELKNYGCRHINLEEIEKEKAAGNIIKEIYRPDPNVSVRSEIYQKSWQEIRNHPVMGIGWGSIGKILGTDERGTSLNSSNIFLEIWLGSGIVGLLAFLTILAYILLKPIRGLFSEDMDKKIISTFIILSFFALMIPNLFNAGIFLGILWIFLGISFIKNIN